MTNCILYTSNHTYFYPGVGSDHDIEDCAIFNVHVDYRWIDLTCDAHNVAFPRYIVEYNFVFHSFSSDTR